MSYKQSDRSRKIADLEKIAKDILNLKEARELRRPLLIEFCGSPKAGKSTTITSLNIFLKRNNFKTVVLTERASVCPIGSKIHPFFNLWTFCSSAAETLKHLDMSGGADSDIIISDRGVFDALCWFEWLYNPGDDTSHLPKKTYNDIKKFILTDIWRDYLDLIFIFKVPPSTSIQREYSNLLTSKRGSIMNEKVLNSFNSSINRVEKKYGKKFRQIITFDTSEKTPDEVNFEVTEKILQKLKDMLEEKIGYFDNSIKNLISYGVNNADTITGIPIKFDNREKIEKTNSVQPVAIAVITNKSRDKVLVVKKDKKRTSADSPEANKLLLYIGGHVRVEDKFGNKQSDTVKRALQREIQEEIGEYISVNDSEPFLIYSNVNVRSSKHLAICYVITMDLENKSFKLSSDEFIRKGGKSKSGQILTISEVLENQKDLEEWSKEILFQVFGVATTGSLFNQTKSNLT